MNTVLEYIKANPGATKTGISEATGIKGLPLFNQLKKLVNDGQLTLSGEGNEATYAAVEPASEETNVVNENNEQTLVLEGEQANSETSEANETKPPVEVETGKTNVQTSSKASTSRNNDKFKFNGQELGKGPLVRELLRHISTEPGMSAKKLKEMFPDELIPRFGVFQEVEKAREISGQKYDRYFFKDEHVIKLKDKKIVVCNQLTSKLLEGIIARAKELGYKIK